MDCFVDFVSPFKGCGSPTPLSGMYLSDLPGIEFANIDEIANAEQVYWKGVWDDLQKTCKDTFREDIITEFGKRYQLKQITQSVDLGKEINANSTTIPGATVSNGILCETMQQGGQCIGSNLMKMYIQTVSFYWNGTNLNPQFTLTFKDADLLTDEFSVTVNPAVQGWNTVWIDKSFNARRMYVLASGNFDNYVQLDLSNFLLDNFGSYNYGFGNAFSYLYFQWGDCGIQSRINGVTFNSNNNVSNAGLNTFGMSMEFTTKCTWDSFVCSNKRQFASAWQHRLAIELLNYRLHTSRINRWVTIEKGQGEKLQKLFLEKYYGGGMYPIGKLQNCVESLVMNDFDGCLKMNDYIMFTESRL